MSSAFNFLEYLYLIKFNQEFVKKKNIMKKYLILIYIAAVSLISCLNAQNEPIRLLDFNLVNTLITEAISERIFPGAALIVWKDGSMLLEKYYGRFTYQTESEVISEKTVFDLASLTKVVATTTAVMICIERNLFSIDDKVKEFIPEFAVNGKENITIRNLLMHNSGLPAWKKFYGRGLDKVSVLEEIYSSELEYKTGTKTVYSDLGIITLGMLVEAVSGMSLDVFCRKEIFNQLEMNSTFFNPDEQVKKLCAPTELDNYWRNKLLQGEVHDETAALLEGVAGHAGLFSTAADLAKFMSMIMNYGVYKNQRILQAETINTFIKKQHQQSSRGLGWDTKSEKGSPAGNLFSSNSFGHTGFTGTSLWADPERNLFVVFLTNRVYPSRENTKIISFRPKLHDAIIKTISN